jgi:hypothetical protein
VGLWVCGQPGNDLLRNVGCQCVTVGHTLYPLRQGVHMVYVTLDRTGIGKPN